MKRVLVEIILAVVLFVGGGLLLWGGTFASNMVHNQLVAQKITFPPKGSTALDPNKFPDLQRYAGQNVDNGPKAKAYANGFIRRHLLGVAGGQTYSQVSAAAQADPQNATLKAKADTLFRGETLRGLLLYAWGWSVVARIALWVAVFAFLAGFGVLFAALLTRPRLGLSLVHKSSARETAVATAA